MNKKRREKIIEDAFRHLLIHLGQNPESEEFKKTPERARKSYQELTSGYDLDDKEILSTTFEEDIPVFDEMILLKGITYNSLCAHHLLSFWGTVDIAYIPDKKVVGLSKLARLVDCFSKRLQVQERLTFQIADSLMKHLKPKGVAVVVRGQHSCMCFRGIQKLGAEMVTSSMLGAFLENTQTRNEFLLLTRK